MDYSETVSYEGVDTRAGAQAKTMKRPVKTARRKEKDADGEALFALEYGDDKLPDANLHVL
jgi:hypothetical protein